MAELTLKQCVIATNGELLGENVAFERLSIDTRTIAEGELFIALSGDNFDGHDYIELAISKGAVAVVCERVIEGLDVPQLVVADSRIALGQIARQWRQQFDLTLIAVTGSNGKTTVKEMLASILSLKGETLATNGNFNNDIGVPLTLMRLNETHRYAVIEMGANHPKEIDYLTHLGLPDVALVNNAGPSHLEGFGSVEGVAHAKAEIYAGLNAAKGTAIVNRDDAYAALWQGMTASYNTLTFGFHEEALLRGEALPQNRLRLTVAAESVIVSLPLLGEHNQRNAMAAAVAAYAAGCDLSMIAEGLEKVEAAKGRLQPIRLSTGAVIIDDTYNANPMSVEAGMRAALQLSSQAWCVLGDLGELGGAAAELHAELGEKAKELGIQRLLTVGQLSADTSRAFGEDGTHYSDIDALLKQLVSEMQPTSVVLVKGSRSAGMERVVKRIIEIIGAAEAAEIR